MWYLLVDVIIALDNEKFQTVIIVLNCLNNTMIFLPLYKKEKI